MGGSRASGGCTGRYGNGRHPNSMWLYASAYHANTQAGAGGGVPLHTERAHQHRGARGGSHSSDGARSEAGGIGNCEGAARRAATGGVAYYGKCRSMHCHGRLHVHLLQVARARSPTNLKLIRLHNVASCVSL
eukprot:scaffold77323_cov78-Phaeocystis_antarctica.AAC.2